MSDTEKQVELKKTEAEMKSAAIALGESLKRQGGMGGAGGKRADAVALSHAARTVLGNGRASHWEFNVPRYRSSKKFCELVLQGWGKADIIEMMGCTSDSYRTQMMRYRAYLLQEIAKRKTDLISDGILKINDRISEKLAEIEKAPEKDKRDLGYWIKARHELARDMPSEQGKGRGTRLVAVIGLEEKEEEPKAIEAEVKEITDGVQTTPVPDAGTEKQE